jgi:polyisoprenyl-teichoic acid--peptidoglycan teichoic acid transferase
MSSRGPDEGPERPPESDGPELEPEFREALRDAAGRPESSAAETEAAEDEKEAEEAEEPEREPDAEEEPEQEPKAEDEPEQEPVAASTEVHTEVHEAVAVAAEAGQAWAPPRPAAAGDPSPPAKRKRFWWRFSLAAVLIVTSVAAATASSILLYIEAWANKLQDSSIKGVDNILDSVPSGGPETILILGSDKRASVKGDPGRSDTTILLRLDPDQHRIALMSIPRDLKVQIPGYGVGKFNTAYTVGGPKLTLRLVKRLTGLEINHLVNVDFLGFVRAVDAIQCVWADVDRRYYHSNEGVPAELQYSEINISSGYQRLCGKDALAYVRYRHTDTDLVRAARQQDFLREARQRVPLDKLIDDRNQLLTIFTSYTTSDIDDAGTMLELLKVLYDARGAAIKEVHFPAVLGPSYVYASKSAIHGAVNHFLGFEASGGPRGESESSGTSGSGGGGRPKKDHKGLKPKPPQSDGLVDASSGGKEMAVGVARKVGVEFPVFYARRVPSGTIYSETPRVYHLRDQDGNFHGAYRMVLQIPQGDYFGVQGIRDWSDPPIVSSPSLTKTMGDRDYDLFLDGDRIRIIAWHEGDNTYWVSNSLLQTLTNDQMLGIARSVGEVIPKPKPKKSEKR